MKCPLHDDEVEYHRNQLELRIDAAAKSVAEVLKAAADLFIATTRWKADEGVGIGKVEASPVVAMMTPQQAAEYLGVNAQTLGIWRCTHRYSIPFVKVGSKVRYRKADLDEFLQCRTKGKKDEDESR